MRIVQATTMPKQEQTLIKGDDVTLVTFLTKGWKHKRVFTVNLDGEGSSFSWFIFVFGSDGQKFPFDIQVNHHAPHTRSRVYARCVLTDRSEVRFSGVGSVAAQAQKSDTYLSLHTLLLSKEAHAHVVQSLEILTKDVSAGHAASVDRFLPNDLFYLETRGLAEKDAKNLLTQGFLSADVRHLAGDTVRMPVLKKISALTESFLH